MKVKLKKEYLQTVQLSWKCIEPMLLAVRGKDYPIKIEMYQQLNEGQQGLYMFYSFHIRTNSTAEFYWFANYYITKVQSWSGIKRAVEFYSDNEMVVLLDAIELFIQKCNQANNSGGNVSPSDLKADRVLNNEVKVLFDKYRVQSENTIDLMNKWIINHEEDFIEINSY